MCHISASGYSHAHSDPHADANKDTHPHANVNPYADAYADAQPDAEPHPDTDANRYANPEPNAHREPDHHGKPDAHAHAYLHRDGDYRRDRNRCVHGDRNHCGHADADQQCNADGVANSPCYGNRRATAERDTDRADGNADCHRRRRPEPHLHADTNADHDSHRYADALGDLSRDRSTVHHAYGVGAHDHAIRNGHGDALSLTDWKRNAEPNPDTDRGIEIDLRRRLRR